ncbi:hypothetical protein PTKU46_86930 [Paraburkholderia terrae]|uniref:hypothetical protein n=1 Tax=Paraburkholderia terrae TaxID=311230 RepID=UPI0030E5BAE2
MTFNYLLATQWDMSRRELVGRTVNDKGCICIQADTLNFQARMDLLRYLLTLDALEIERAEQHDADPASGCIEDTPEKRDLCEVQFEMIMPTQLVAIEFMLSMHHYAPHAFPALSAWYEIHRLGKWYPIPDVEPFPKVPVANYGVRPRLVRTRAAHPSIDSTRFWLNETILRLPTGSAQRYQEMAVRGEYFARLAERLNLTPSELDRYLIDNAISDAASRSIEGDQMDVFALAA